MNCEYCQSPVHIWFQCPKKPDGWKPARLAKKSTDARNADEQGVVKGDLVGTRALASTSDRGLVGQSRDGVLPVDTNGSEAQKVERRSPKPEDAGSIPATSANAGSSNGRTSGFGPVNAGSTPAPASKFDKKAWMKAYMKTYIRQYREDVKAGKRVPKKRE